MGDLVSRSALLEEHCGGCSVIADGLFYCDVCEAPRLILEAPAVDAVEVVRCKECKVFGDISPYTGAKFDFKYCTKFGNATKETDFCSYGERRVDDGRSKAD